LRHENERRKIESRQKGGVRGHDHVAFVSYKTKAYAPREYLNLLFVPGHWLSASAVVLLAQQAIDAMLVVGLVRDFIGQPQQSLKKVRVTRHRLVGLRSPGKMDKFYQQLPLGAEEQAIDM
jgi:hypothetical protein